MLSSTSTDFCEMAWSSSPLSLPAPGNDRSMTNLGICVPPLSPGKTPVLYGTMSVHGRRTNDHDRDTGDPGRGPEVMTVASALPLQSALERLRVEGAIFLRAEYSEAWEFESPDASTSAGLLHPGAERIVLFHVVARGRCFISLG